MPRNYLKYALAVVGTGALMAAGAAGAVAPTSARAATGDPVLAVGGDIACPPGKTVDATHCGQGKTGAVVTAINPNYVIPVGDTQYDSGTPAEYAGSYNTTGWGTDKAISRPAAGNHEYRTTGATGYYGYFGSNAGDPTKGYYSWNVPIPGGTHWHMIALNSECAVLGGGVISAGCGAGSTQEKWLKADLAANPNVCTIAYWHRPRFSSSPTTPSSTTYTAFWNDLYAAGADIVLNGHAHDYERFRPQTSAGVADPKGPVEFVVGTGGDDFQKAGPPIANSAIFNNSAFGALQLTLHANSYDYQFVPAAGYSLSDSGSGTCHSSPTPDTTPPSAPLNVSASAATPNQANLNWLAATDNVGVTNYIIYRGANGATPTQIASTTTSATSYTDTTVVANTTYTYQVAAQDAAGNPGPLSSPPASVTTPASADTTPPTTPTNLAAEQVFYNEIDLGWTGSTDTGTGVSGYNVYRQGPGDSTFTLLATTTGTGAGHNSYVDTTVKPSSAYTYQVSAVDGAGNESGKASVTTSTPAGPSTQTYTFTPSDDATIQQANATATGNTSSLIVDNSPVDDALLRFNVATTGCDTLTSAKLTLTNNNDGSTKGGDFYTTGTNWSEGSVTWNSAPTRGTLLNSLGAVAANATVSVDVTQGATLNGPMAVRVGTTTSDGVRYFSKEGTGGKPTLTVVCSSATVPDTQAPSAPSNLNATAVPGEIDLSWTASTDNIGVTNYDIYRGGSFLGTVAGNALTYQDTTVNAGTSYTYAVRARDAAGNSSPDSNSASATATAARPAAPTGLTASATSSTSVHLTWNANTTDTLQGYNVYRALHSGGTASLVGSVGAGTTSFDDTTAAAGTSYDYQVTAVATGGTESLPSNTATVTTPGSGGGGGGGITTGAEATTTVTTAATSWTVNLPSFSPGDFVVVWVANNLGSTAGTPTASGWTTQVSTNESSGLKGAFLTRRMASGDPSTITVTWSLATSGLTEATAFTGVNTTTPVDAKAGAAEPSSTAVATHTTPAVTAGANDVLVSGFTTNNASTWTASDSELADAASGTSVSAAMYASAPVAAGTYTRSATASVGSVKAVSSVLALRPA